MTFELSVPSFFILEIMFVSDFSWQKTLDRRKVAVKVKNSFLILYGLRKRKVQSFLFFENFKRVRKRIYVAIRGTLIL